MSVPSALCLLESNTFLLLTADFWQILECLSCLKRQEKYSTVKLLLPRGIQELLRVPIQLEGGLENFFKGLPEAYLAPTLTKN